MISIATIQTQAGMVLGIQSMNNALNVCISSFQTLQNVSNRAVDPSGLAKAGNAAAGLAGKVKNIATGIAKVLNLSDALVQTSARLALINDGSQTTAELQAKIFQSAQRARASYQTTADAVLNFSMQAGQEFSSNDEMIAFTEQLNKTFAIAGASADGVKTTMRELAQSMATGRLQGEALNAVLTNAGPIVTNIQNYLKNVEGMPPSAVDNIKQLASDGVITAELIKNAMFYAAEETNRKFESLPKTFGQVWTLITNSAQQAVLPFLEKLNKIINGERFNNFLNGIVGGLMLLGEIAGAVIDVMADNWSLLEPILWGLIAAYTVYNATAGIAWLTTLKEVAAKIAHTAAAWAETAAIIALELAQHGLNAALAMCPVSWIVMAIIGLIAVFYLAVAAINKFAGTSLNATGLIMGFFYTAGAAIANVVIALVNSVMEYFALLWNYIAGFVEFFANCFNDPLGSIARLFAHLADTVLGIMATIANSIDTIFGTKLASKVEGWRSGLNEAVDSRFGEEVVKVKRIDPKAMRLKGFDYGTAWQSGYTLGERMGNFDFSSFGTGQGLDKLKNDLANPAANTDMMTHSPGLGDEGLTDLRDSAGQDAVNRFTTAEIKLDMTNYNNVNQEVDLDGMTNYLRDLLLEKMRSVAEKVHS